MFRLSPDGSTVILFLFNVHPMLPSGSTLYTHTDLPRITMELWELLVVFTGSWLNNFTYD